MNTAHFEVEARKAAAYLVSEGGSPRVVSELTGLSLHFSRRLVKERTSRPSRRGSVAEGLWGNRTGILQATLFGLCVRWVEAIDGRQVPVLQKVQRAYRLFLVVCDGALACRRVPFSPDEAYEVLSKDAEALLTSHTCGHCGGVFWLERGRVRLRCPICNEHHRPAAAMRAA